MDFCEHWGSGMKGLFGSREMRELKVPLVPSPTEFACFIKIGIVPYYLPQSLPLPTFASIF